MASKSIISNINLNGNQIENAKFEVLSSAPTNPVTGRMYYDSTKNKIGYYDGSKWVYNDEVTVTASKALVSNSSGKVAASSVTSTELGYVSGVTSSIQTQLNSKQGTLTFDDTPTSSSNNPVKSGGIDSAIKNNQRVFYAVTETAGATAVKEFTIADFPTETVNGVKTPLKGTIITVTSTNTDARSAQLKFKINDGGEFPIWYNLEEFNSTDTNDKIFGNPIKTYTYTFNGTHWCWTSHGSDNNTIYTAGTGLKLSSNQFSLNVPRVAKSCNSLPGKNTAIIEEYGNGDNYNLPSNAFYHILTFEGNDTNYATQLALGMTATAAYYRNYHTGTWESWESIINTDHTYTPNSLGFGYVKCDTPAETIAKEVTIPNFNLTIGALFVVKFTYAVQTNATLSVNGSSNFTIYCGTGGTRLQSGIINEGDVVTFYHDGISLIVISIRETNLGSNLIKGTLPISHGGTGATTANAAQYNICGNVKDSESAISDTSRVVIMRETSLSTANGAFIAKAGLKFWNYIKSKIDSITQSVSTADSTHQGLAESSDVKSYVDNKTSVIFRQWVTQ